MKIEIPSKHHLRDPSTYKGGRKMGSSTKILRYRFIEGDVVKYFATIRDIAKYLDVAYCTLLDARKKAKKGYYANSELGRRLKNITIEKLKDDERQKPKRASKKYDKNNYMKYKKYYQEYYKKRNAIIKKLREQHASA